MPSSRLAGSAEPVLTTRALNRALLARQHLLERAPVAPMTMVEHLVGMQAQNPGDPYVGLWSRVDGFRPGDLSAAIEARQAVRMGLLRTTLHLVSASDAVTMWPVVRGVPQRTFRSTSFRKDLDGVDLASVVAAARAAVDGRPWTMAALGRHLAERWPDHAPNSLGQAARFHLPIVQVPPRGLWGRRGQAAWQSLESWLGLGGPLEGDGSPDGLVLRYLAAFGPASVKDVAIWSWLTGIRPVIERLRPRLRVFRDERGAELFDVPDGPLPDPETPAPVRFLPEYDNIALSHADRSRIIAPEAFGRLTGFVGTFLVDGFVAGQWRLDRTKAGAAMVLQPFVALDRAQRRDLVAEAHRLLEFLAPDAVDAGRVEVGFGAAREAAVADGVSDPGGTPRSRTR
jgi:hypothetical protein